MKITRTISQAAPQLPVSMAATIRRMQKDYGPDIMVKPEHVFQPVRVSTGIFLLDLAMLGGFPLARLIGVSGENSSGKTSLAALFGKNMQLMFPDSFIVINDVEGTSDPVWLEKLGLDMTRTYIAQPQTGEAAIDATIDLIKEPSVSLVVVDSVAALVPSKELDGSVSDELPGLQARLVNKLIRKANSTVVTERMSGHKVTVLLLNQFRSKIGMSWGDPRVEPGGKALEFYATIRMIIKNKEQVRKNARDIEVVAFNEHSFTLKKNKLNGGLRAGDFQLCRQDNEDGLQEGMVDDAHTVLTYASKFDIFSGAGQSWDLDIWGNNYHFKSKAEAAVFLYQNLDTKTMLQDCIIQAQARDLRMPESFINRFVEKYQ